MIERQYTDNYNYHDWAKFMVTKSENKPTGPHFAAVLFGTRSEWTPSYDQFDSRGGSTHTVNEITYFAFPTKEILDAWLLRASKENKKFFFFEVKKLGEIELKVSTSVSV